MTERKKKKNNLKAFSTPGLAQAQVLARVGRVQNEPESFQEIINGLLARLESGSEQDIEMILHSQIAMLNTLAAHFMIKSLGGYDSSEILQSLPQIPLEFANLSLKCQAEMRRCIELLHDLKNPKKPSQFIKNYVHNQLNELQVQQEELKQQLEATKYVKLDNRKENETISSDPALEALEEVNGTSNA